MEIRGQGPNPDPEKFTQEARVCKYRRVDHTQTVCFPETRIDECVQIKSSPSFERRWAFAEKPAPG